MCDCAREDEEAARLMTIPGVGPITAMALQAFAPPMESFRRGRDFAAWLGLVPRQHKTGGVVAHILSPNHPADRAGLNCRTSRLTNLIIRLKSRVVR